jgi:RPA family protein
LEFLCLRPVLYYEQYKEWTPVKTRHTAARLCISDLLAGDFRNDDGPAVFVTPEIEVRRVVLVGNVLDEPSGMEKYAKTVLDDSTGVIDLRAWGSETKLILNLKQGVFVRVIGRVRFYNGMIYITPEIITELSDANYQTLHFLERRVWFARQEKQVTNRKSSEPQVEFM